MARTRFLLSTLLLLLFQYCCAYIPILITGSVAAQTNISTDQSALLALKSHITIDPQNILTTNWSTSNSDICNWVGVTCGARHLRVTTLNLSYMGLTGTIPSHLGNLSFLVQLEFRNNSFGGTLPPELSNLRRLKLISFEFNDFEGTIPSWFGLLSKLQTFNLYGNQFSGSIPNAIFNLSALQVLNLRSNQLSGTIPREIERLTVLQEILLGNNNFKGSIAREIGNLTMLKRIYLDFNMFEEIPNLIGSKDEMEWLYVQANALTGPIPLAVFNMSSLTILALNGNNLSGSFPDNICQHLPSIQVLNLAHNQFDGPLPHKLWQCKELLSLVLDYNNFSGSIPRSIGNLTQLTRLGFGNNTLTGTLSDGIDIAVKIFDLQLEGAFKSFERECETLSNIRHRNLIKIISCCSQLDFKALVLNYMPNGSLDKWLYSHNSSFNILNRLNIMVDVALVVEYLHHGYSVPIVHCDLKPSNILLDGDMVAHVADFGIAKLLGFGDSMTQTMTLATVGYMAPEYGMDGIVSTQGDVYSFGIVVMETFTKMKPTNEMFVDEMNLKQWVANSLSSEAIAEVVDANLFVTQGEDPDFATKIDCLSSIMRLALACCAELPDERINMQEAVATLKKTKIKFLQDAARSAQLNRPLVHAL
ncbi:putative receptor-like protein kinase At3g47110 isoform X2 [Malus sylvestris]|uniref:putative receptor-like protein kinase At3g47110 isoform X2 n=1 Tax=Malus sylvestris TaxID=3752 RepID=UPI0021ACABD8|nr:putative receptor-like protein kinase At3g47110 isoform X2 [Malus sylvestris]